MKLLLFAAITTVAVGLTPVNTNADAIPEGGWGTRDCPPNHCMPGTIPYGGSHGSCSIGCSPNSACEDDVVCGERYGAGATCEPTRFCMEEVDSGNSINTVVTGECPEDGVCEAQHGSDSEARCVEESRCIAPPYRRPQPGEPGGGPLPGQETEQASSTGANPAPSSGGCAGCAASESSAAGAGFWLALVWGLRQRSDR